MTVASPVVKVTRRVCVDIIRDLKPGDRLTVENAYHTYELSLTIYSRAVLDGVENIIFRQLKPTGQRKPYLATVQRLVQVGQPFGFIVKLDVTNIYLNGRAIA